MTKANGNFVWNCRFYIILTNLQFFYKPFTYLLQLISVLKTLIEYNASIKIVEETKMTELKQIQKIKNAYTEHKQDKFDELREMNRKVYRPVQIFAYVFGAIACLIMGAGMCLVMPDVIEGMMIPGIIIGIVGMGLCYLNWIIYKKRINSRKKKYANEIIALSDEILKERANKNEN